MRVDGLVPATATISNNGVDVLSKLKPGDTIRAQILENSGSELTLKLSDGSKVVASAIAPVDAQNGEFVSFVFKGTIDGKPALEVASRNIQPQADAALENIKNTLTELKLPVTAQNIELAQALKGQNVPVTSDSMSKMIDLVSKNTELKPASAAFLTAANMTNDKNNIEKLQSLLAGRLKISNDIGELVKLINSEENNTATSKVLNQANSAIAMNKDGAILNTQNASVNGNIPNAAAANNSASVKTATIPSDSIVNGSSTASLNNNADKAATVNSNIVNNTDNFFAGATRTTVSNLAHQLIEGAKENATTINTNTNSTNSLADGSSANNSSSIALQISNLIKDGTPLGKADVPLLNSLNSQLDSMLSKGDLSVEEQSAAKIIAKEINVVIFKIQGHETASEQVNSNANSIKNFEATVNNLKNLFVKIDQKSEEINPAKLYKDLDNALQALKSSIQQLPMTMRETAMNIANNLESNVNFINQLNNYSSYVQIPLSIFNQNTTGELYMLKKGSKSKKLDPSNMTVLISLDGNNIGRIDTLLSIDKKNISTNFRLENCDVFNELKENHRMLYMSMLEKGYRLVDFTYRLMDEPINIINFEAEAKKEFIKSPNNIDIVI